MISYLKYRLALGKLFRARRTVTKAFEEELKKSGPEARERISSQEQFELSEIEDSVHRLETDKLWEEAKKLLVPIPRHDDEGMWEESKFFGRYHLTVKGVNKLRSDIRAERRSRVEFFLSWSALLIGIIGALTGLIAVLQK
jgi:hypothetical protein